MVNETYWNRDVEGMTFTTPLPDRAIINKIPSGSRILDFGCGYGRVSRYLSDLGYKIVGLDISVGLINRAEHARIPNAQFIVGGVDEIPEDGSFDCAVICGVIENFISPEDRLKLVNKLFLSLKDKGQVYLETFVQDSSYKAGYKEAVSKNHRHGTLLLKDIVIFHDSPEGIDDLFQTRFIKVYSRLEKYTTWSGKSVDGYTSVFMKKYDTAFF